jgi:hypothetical protein
MKRNPLSSRRGLSPFLRTIALILIPLQALTVWPMPVLLAEVGAPGTPAGPAPTPALSGPKLPFTPSTPPPVKAVKPGAASGRSRAVTFSANPSDAEITGARLFAEPLLPIGNAKSTPAENQALAEALVKFAKSPDPDNTEPLRQFLDGHPQSVWQVSLLTNLGLIQRQGGYWSEAMASWQEAWNLGKNEKEGNRRLIVDHALGQLAELNARLGRVSDLEALFAEAGDRTVRGMAIQKWS